MSVMVMDVSVSTESILVAEETLVDSITTESTLTNSKYTQREIANVPYSALLLCHVYHINIPLTEHSLKPLPAIWYFNSIVEKPCGDHSSKIVDQKAKWLMLMTVLIFISG